jgi:hypothetical protein
MYFLQMLLLRLRLLLLRKLETRLAKHLVDTLETVALGLGEEKVDGDEETGVEACKDLLGLVVAECERRRVD